MGQQADLGWPKPTKFAAICGPYVLRFQSTKGPDLRGFVSTRHNFSTACHAEGRGFESHQPLRQSSCKSASFIESRPRRLARSRPFWPHWPIHWPKPILGGERGPRHTRRLRHGLEDQPLADRGEPTGETMNPRLAIASRRVARRAATDVPGSRRTPLGQAGPDLRRSTFGSAHVCTRRPQRPATAIRPRARRCSTAHAHRSQRHPIAPRAAAVATRAQATSPKPFVRLSITPASPTEATASGGSVRGSV